MQPTRKLVRVFSLMAGGVLLSIAAQTPARAQTADAAQIEKGRLVVTEVCASCHTTITRMVQVHKFTPEEWKSTVYFMISRGAQVMPDEIDAVTAYLASAGGKGGQAAGGGRGGAGRGAAGGGAEGQTAEAGGRAVLQRNCQQCHELTVASSKKDSEQWSAVVSRMVTYGARLSSGDQEKLIEYLNTLAK
jgi:mono/diheme cytochrome c family protein